MNSSTESAPDYAFAFDCVTFSDRILRLEMIAPVSFIEKSTNRKRAREDETPESEEAVVRSNQDSQSGVTEIHISTPILAAQSPFFLKLISKSESGSKLTLKIHPSEEAAVMELLRFMYSNSLSVKTTPELLDVLVAADKFDVALCMNYCSHVLLSMPMTPDFALLLLNLPSSVLMADSVKPLENAATQFIASHYNYRSKRSDLMALPLVVIKTMVKSDNLQFKSEDDVYDLVLEWVKSKYSAVEERQNVLDSHLVEYIRFSQMTCLRLVRILTTDKVKPTRRHPIVFGALNFKAESLSQRRILPACGSFVERAYIQRPVKVVEFEVPHEQCIVYWDIKRKECEGIDPELYTQGFVLGGRELYLKANRNKVDTNHSFSLLVWRKGDNRAEESIKVEYELSARGKPKEEFESRFRGCIELVGGQGAGCRDLFQIPWDALMADDCRFFINDLLHLRADISLCRSHIS